MTPSLGHLAFPIDGSRKPSQADESSVRCLNEGECAREVVRIANDFSKSPDERRGELARFVREQKVARG